ncbi:MAG: hypothetical protein AB7L09_03000 [Nitrospira sp.]
MNFDKVVYYERTWMRCELLSQHGSTLNVRLGDGMEIRVPFQLVRDVNAECKKCFRLLWTSSYQALSGDSYCSRCYERMDFKEISLLFGGYQWISWDGQMSISDMEDDHLINTIARLKRNAEEAAEHARDTPEQHLRPQFGHLVEELQRRRPNDAGTVKMNSMLLAMWAVIMTILIRVGYTPSALQPAEPRRAPAIPPGPKKARRSNRSTKKVVSTKAKKPKIGRSSPPPMPW